MKNEADFKKAFKKSVKAFKGYSMTLAAPTISGIPDLYVIIKGYMPVLIEAKWLGELNNPTFKRKINYSPLQLHWIRESNKVQRYASMGLVGLKRADKIYCILQEVDTLNNNYITHNFIIDYNYVVYTDKLFSVQTLFELANIPKINNFWVDSFPGNQYNTIVKTI